MGEGNKASTLRREGENLNATGRERRRFGKGEREIASMLRRERNPKEGEQWPERERKKRK